MADGVVEEHAGRFAGIGGNCDDVVISTARAAAAETMLAIHGMRRGVSVFADLADDLSKTI